MSREREVVIRHSAVSAESDVNILAWITGKAEKNAAVTRTDIENYCREVCKIEVTRGWVDSFISGHLPMTWRRKARHKKSRVCRFHECFLTKLYAARTRLYRVVQPI
jgi:hypothetical protein